MPTASLWDTPLAVGADRVANRIVFPALSPNWADAEGRGTPALEYFYDSVARGGPGMVIIAGTAVSPEGRGSDRTLCLYEAAHRPGLSRLLALVRAQGCLAAIQLMHAGGQANPAVTGLSPLSPSGIPCQALGNRPLAMTAEDIGRVRDRFVQAALWAQADGAQAVELHLAHGYLLHEFLSPRTNRRTDAYGGSPENRRRLVTEIITAIREAAPRLVVGARITGEDFLDGGLHTEDAARLAGALARSGLDYCSVTAGVYDAGPVKHQAMAAGRFFDYARTIRQAVSIPVIGVGRIGDIPAAESRLAAGACDLVAIGRGLVADPDMLRRFRRGETPVRCLECGRCMYLRQGYPDLDCPLRRFPPR